MALNLFDLLELKKQADVVKVSADPAVFLQLVQKLGFDDSAMVESVAKAVRLTAKDPEETITQWFNGGGFARLLAGRKTGEESQDQETVLQCPHCTGYLILSAQ